MRIGWLPGPIVRLAFVAVAAVLVLFMVRLRFVPDTFGDIGHYRAASLDVVADQEPRYGGHALCAECHDDEAEAKAASFHRGLSCEGCHGPAAAHADDPTEQAPDIPTGRETCLRCHDYLASRPTGFPQILERVHNPLQPCAECHDPHDPTPPEVPGQCSACHAAISRMKAVSHHWSLECETCHEAPAEHRENPRAYLPKKPTRRDFCGQCHAGDAGGSSDVPRVDLANHGNRYMCWQCHYPHSPEGT
jgi:hypothetical protein